MKDQLEEPCPPSPIPPQQAGGSSPPALLFATFLFTTPSHSKPLTLTTVPTVAHMRECRANRECNILERFTMWSAGEFGAKPSS